MRTISSPNTFKTCYIAQIKKDLGFPVRKAANRKGKDGITKVNETLRPFIEKAILILNEKTGEIPSYKDVQQLSFKLYKESKGKSESDALFGSVKFEDTEFVKSIAEDKDIFYEC